LDFGGDEKAEALRLASALGISGSANRLILFGDVDATAQLLPLVQNQALHHLIAESLPNALDRVVLTARRLLDRTSAGISPYLPWGLRGKGFQISASSHRSTALAEMASDLEALGLSDRFKEAAATVADEFMMNAIWDAPVDENGKRLFNHLSRETPITLPEDRRVEFRYACSGTDLYLTIFDSFGSLALDTVLSNLERTLKGGSDQINQASGGAGLGLFMILESLVEWVVDVEPGTSTLMVGRIHVGGSFRQHLAMPKSLHLFGGGPA
ncbi:MAG: hypothetical protein KC561_19460, partial [Myxococcales bacterium]|nr:hypothetical protein [Myxococcales bacterium]